MFFFFGDVRPTRRLLSGGQGTCDKSATFEILKVGQRVRLPPRLEKLFPACIRRVGVDGDGSCLFHAIAAAQHGRPMPKSEGHKIRKGIARWATLKNFRDGWLSYEKNLKTIDLELPRKEDDASWQRKLDDFKDKMMDMSVWADLTMIPFVMVALNVNLVFFDGEDIYCSVHYYNAKRNTIFIAWSERCHFEVVMCSATNQTASPATSTYNGTSQEFYPGYFPPTIAKKVMQQYNKTCRHKIEEIFDGGQFTVW